MSEAYYNTEAYLKQFEPKQWLEAATEVYQGGSAEMLKLGFAIAQSDGWRHIAPAWMKKFETEDIKPLEGFKQ